jgi:RND family efflux transporter MFP subunit
MIARAPLAALAALLLAAHAPATSPAPEAHFAPVEAIAEARHDLALGFTLRGRVMAVLVQPGQPVAAGQPLIKLDGREAEAALKLATIRAASELDAEASEAAWKLAVNEEARLREAVSKGGAASFELERAGLESTRARLTFEASRQRRAELAVQEEQARLLLEKFTLTAPIAGVIEEVRVEPGEMVDEVRPVLRLVAVDPLWIDAPAPVALAATLSPGARAWVRFTSEPGAQPVEGKVVHVAGVADPGSETRLVRVETANAQARPAGSHVLVTFTPPPTDTAPR